MRIPIKGVIVPNDDKWIYEWLDIDAVCPREVLSALEAANGEPADIDIHSGGGDVYAGIEIYDALLNYSGTVHIHVISAASAAGVIACARDSDISPAGNFMLHNVSAGGVSGDHGDMEHMADVLRAHDRSIAGAYTAKTGMPPGEILKLMERETYLPASEAVALGFIDRIAEAPRLVASRFGASVIPSETIAKLKNLVKHPAQNEADILMRKAKARLELIKLGGQR